MLSLNERIRGISGKCYFSLFGCVVKKCGPIYGKPLVAMPDLIFLLFNSLHAMNILIIRAIRYFQQLKSHSMKYSILLNAR